MKNRKEKDGEEKKLCTKVSISSKLSLTMFRMPHEY